MGYYVFSVVLRDGRKLPFTTGGAVDFPSLPAGVTTNDIIDVLPGFGQGRFHSRGPLPSESNAEYAWLIYEP